MTPPTIFDHPDPNTILLYEPFTRKGLSPMAEKVEIHLEDGLDGSPAGHTLSFTLDGKDYKIDLSDTNAEKLREDPR